MPGIIIIKKKLKLLSLEDRKCITDIKFDIMDSIEINNLIN